MSQFISRDDLKALINSDSAPVIVEALPNQYYSSGHLPGAINIPHDDVGAKAEDHIPDKSETVIVYCANSECQNSHIAADSLTELGYTSVYVYKEGKKDWQEAGLPLE